MKKAIIIGAGFAGLAAINKLKKLKNKCSILLFDKNNYSTLISSLPDLAGNKVKEKDLTCDINKLIPNWLTFKQEAITNIDLKTKKIISEKNTYDYDYLIIAAGSKTNFFDFNDNVEKTYRMDSFTGAKKIKDDFLSAINGEGFTKFNNFSKPINVVISGAGFNGLELGCSLKKLSLKHKTNINMSIVQIENEILPFLDKKNRDYIIKYLNKMNIEIITNTKVIKYDGKDVKLSNDKVIKDVFFCWTAGTRSSIDNIIGKVEKLFDGRIKVNEYLEIPNYQDVFAVGDSAAILKDGKVLRKAVYFAVKSGQICAKNLINKINNKNMVKYKGYDPGWVVPLTDISVGKLYNINLRGKLGIRVHYLIHAMRSFSFRNRIKYFIKSIFLD